jgi:RNA polymerase sigma factor (sigma-70 family)
VEKTDVADAVGHDLTTLFGVGVVGVLSDGQLLDCFVERREGAAFEEIIRRHGPMVWGVCRRTLRNHHDAEDAFQAAFLVLARKAASIMPREKLGNWLYGVAYQTAMKARAQRTKRRARESQAPDGPEPMATSDEPRDDRVESLDRELSRLPEKYRIPIVLCDLEGSTHKDVASRLGWPIGTVSSRLSRARSELARRLSRQGVSLSASSLAVFLARESVTASMPTQLIDRTVQAASLFVAGGAVTAGLVSREVAILTGEVVRVMLSSKLKIALAGLLVGVTLTVVGTGVAEHERSSKEGNGETDRRKKPAVGKGAVVPVLPPSEMPRVIGGDPDGPRYVGNGDLFFVTSANGEKFSIYDAATNKASTVRLNGSKEQPLQATPIMGTGNLISLMLKGSKLTRICVFSRADWKWYPQDLKEPVAGTLTPTLGHSVAGCDQDGTIYAFSADARRWSILELPEDAPASPGLRVLPDSIVVEYLGHIHEFSGKTGTWKHTDLRALIDAAIKAAEDEAK